MINIEKSIFLLFFLRCCCMVIKDLNILDMSQIYTPHVGDSESKGRLLNFHSIFSFWIFPFQDH